MESEQSVVSEHSYKNASLLLHSDKVLFSFSLAEYVFWTFDHSFKSPQLFSNVSYPFQNIVFKTAQCSAKALAMSSNTGNTT